MGKIQRKNTQSIHEAFPDRPFTKEELRKFSKAVKEAGSREKWLAKKGFISTNKDGSMRAVIVVEGIIGKPVIKGIPIHYQTDIPYSFWTQIAFPQLDRYEYGLNKGSKENEENLEKFAGEIRGNMQIF